MPNPTISFSQMGSIRNIIASIDNKVKIFISTDKNNTKINGTQLHDNYSYALKKGSIDHLNNADNDG